jgi:hypothetical protein
LTQVTRQLLEHFLRPKWFQTAAVLGHAKQFFDDLEPASAKDPAFLERLRLQDAKLREYLSYVLLDFVTADPELAEMPLAAALELARELDWSSPFEKLAARELKIRARDMKQLKEQAAAMLAKAEANGE